MMNMTRESARDILALNKKSYQTIALKFSQTRQHPWDDFRWIDPYIMKGGSVLDIGCGNGRLYEYLQTRDISYTGIDLSTNFIQIAKQELSGKKYNSLFAVGDILGLESVQEIRDYKFDVIIGVAVLCHIPKPFHRQAIGQLKKFLSKNGVIIMYNWNLWQPSLRRKTVYKSLRDRVLLSQESWRAQYGIKKNGLGLQDVMTLWRATGVDAPLYYYAFTKNELKRLFESGGFKIINNCYTKNGNKANWFSGSNIVTVAKLD